MTTLTYNILLLFLLTLATFSQQFVTKQAAEEFIVSEHPMEWSEAEEWCKAKNCKLANLTGESAGDVASIALESYLGPVTLWCTFASLEPLVQSTQTVFHVWDNMFYGPDVSEEDNKNYTICQRKSIAGSM